jgi:hypothetical protein
MRFLEKNKKTNMEKKLQKVKKKSTKSLGPPRRPFQNAQRKTSAHLDPAASLVLRADVATNRARSDGTKRTRRTQRTSGTERLNGFIFLFLFLFFRFQAKKNCGLHEQKEKKEKGPKSPKKKEKKRRKKRKR